VLEGDLNVTRRNRQWLLQNRPQDRLKLENFRFHEADFILPDLEDGQILVRNRMFACAPTLRNGMNEPGRSYAASATLNEPIAGMAGVEVLQSRNDEYPVGARLVVRSRWEDFSVITPDASMSPVLRVPNDMTIEDAMGIYGMNSLAAYFGMLRVARPRRGETVVVSGAAGSTGSMAAQIARIHGCRVIGIAGGQSKCEWLREGARISETIDYKSEDVAARLAQLCPEGVSAFFDNVGGTILQAVVDNIARRGRIALCGQIAAYNSDSSAPGPRDMMKLVYGAVRIEGFLLSDFIPDIEQARTELVKWNNAGELVHRVDVREGFENLPSSFLDLFSGANAGTLLVRTV
jgi:NADPH-dependent curcumin reductase CurA